MFSKKWHGFIYAIHKESKLLLLRMILEVCDYKSNKNIINMQDSQSPIDFLFLLLTMIPQQKSGMNKTHKPYTTSRRL